MSRVVNLILILLVVLGVGYVYQIKGEAEEASDRAAALQGQIDEVRQTIEILQAEWSHLSRPDRIQTLVERYEQQLQLGPMEVYQFSTLDDVPLRPIELDPLSRGALGGVAAGQPGVLAQ
ncbi:cell division protein FtsL [Coralliovum pocilloporae]|uniref:cell division protein FtsL n=1 Tax=Coralliovum pocilloporae TaxID=3066369 RepID=UPI003306D59A